MIFLETSIAGAWLIEPSPRVDERGLFMRAWCRDEFAEAGIDFQPYQSNLASSRCAGTVRGLHYQESPALEAKLVRCTMGAIFDVLVDLRVTSPTFGRWFGTELSAANRQMLYVPPLCAHGYQTLVDDTEIYYMASTRYAPESVRGVRFDDPSLDIAWPRLPQAVSQQDCAWPLLDLTTPRVHP